LVKEALFKHPISEGGTVKQAAEACTSHASPASSEDEPDETYLEEIESLVSASR
jgi:hypothetical protein